MAAAFEPGDHATTFGGTPLATAAARAVLAEMERIDAPALAGAPGARLTAAPRRPSPGVTAVRGVGLLLAAELRRARRQGRSPPRCSTRGLVVNAVTPDRRCASPRRSTVSDDEIDEAVRASSPRSLA